MPPATEPLSLNGLVASPLELEHVEQIRCVDGRLRVTFRPDLIGQPRHAADHQGDLRRTREQAAEWDELLSDAEVLFDFDRIAPDLIARRAPRLRWIQSSSSGVRQLILRGGF